MRVNQGKAFAQFWEVAIDASGNWRPVGDEFGPTTTGVLKSGLPMAIGSRVPGLAWEVESVRIGDGAFAIVSDLTGALYAYDVTNILLSPTSGLDELPLLAEWQTPPSFFDDLDNIILDIEVDTVGPTEARILVAVRRGGVVHVDFNPGLGSSAFTDSHPQGTLQTPEYASALSIQQVPGGQRLVVSDYGGGLRLFGR